MLCDRIATVDYMYKTIEELNMLPLNKRAKDMLIIAGETPDGSSMHSVQLALWGIEKGKISTDYSVVETVKAMLSWMPARIMNFFMLPAGGDNNPKGWDDARTPEELAGIVLDYIEDKMSIHFPYYRSAE